MDYWESHLCHSRCLNMQVSPNFKGSFSEWPSNYLVLDPSTSQASQASFFFFFTVPIWSSLLHSPEPKSQGTSLGTTCPLPISSPRQNQQSVPQWFQILTHLYMSPWMIVYSTIMLWYPREQTFVSWIFVNLGSTHHPRLSIYLYTEGKKKEMSKDCWGYFFYSHYSKETWTHEV